MTGRDASPPPITPERCPSSNRCEALDSAAQSRLADHQPACRLTTAKSPSAVRLRPPPPLITLRRLYVGAVVRCLPTAALEGLQIRTFSGQVRHEHVPPAGMGPVTGVASAMAAECQQAARFRRPDMTPESPASRMRLRRRRRTRCNWLRRRPVVPAARLKDPRPPVDTSAAVADCRNAGVGESKYTAR